MMRARKISPERSAPHQKKMLLEISLGFVLLVAVFFCYWNCLSFPFIQDDWGVMYSILHEGTQKFLSNALNPSGGTLYRPLGQIYLWVAFSVFGLNPTGYHIAALLLHALNSLLVVLVSRRIDANYPISWATGLLYATAVSIHADSLSWVVGIYDVLGAFFFMFAFLLYLERKPALSLASYVLALLSKESTVVLPLLLLFEILIFQNGGRPVSKIIVEGLKSLKLHLLAGLAYVLLLANHILGASVSSTGDEYRIRFLGIHLFDNLYTYYKWWCQLFYPLYRIDWTGWFVLAVTILTLGAVLLTKRTARRMLVFPLGWAVIALLPVLVLTQHAYRYYMTYSLPALYLALLLLVWNVGRENIRYFIASAVVLVFFNVAFAHDYVGRNTGEGFDPTMMEGTNDLPLKRQWVEMVRNHLSEHYSTLDPHTIMVFDGMFSGVFAGSAGPRIWYNDTTLRVFDSDQIDIDSLGVYTNESNPRVFFDPEKVIVLTFNGNTLRSVRLSSRTK